ncbi:hypothetical protein QTN47_21050 [Danxiaibacter flavus]|uniref:Molecular chaperone n=1 Tax=Danxiaibacter flavus TaxID=3049108 RepID=A0ABV3ZKG1_9BACT|nr:hypothetical protein QNM32_21055 [Chitinophagaceae bacterium DXS]
MPKRVVFEGVKRSEELNLANIGHDTATYIISVMQIRMKDDGSVEKIDRPDSGQNFADRNFRFFPHTVTLAPNEVQAVKVQLIKSSELATGEYRSHLYFRAIRNSDPLGEKELQKDSGISVKLVPVFGMSIPVIIRVGENTSKVSFSDISFHLEKETDPVLKITFNRTGNMSVYGDVQIDHISLQGKVTRVGTIKGVAIYTPNALRHLQFELYKINGIDYHTGTLQITYNSSNDTKLSEAEINLN